MAAEGQQEVVIAQFGIGLEGLDGGQRLGGPRTTGDGDRAVESDYRGAVDGQELVVERQIHRPIDGAGLGGAGVGGGDGGLRVVLGNLHLLEF